MGSPDARQPAHLLGGGLLLECVVTSANPDGSPHIAAMGPIVNPAFTRALLRPFRGSATLRNLRHEPRCVMNITDDVELIATAALGRLGAVPPLEPTPGGGWSLAEGCRWYDLRVESIDDSAERAAAPCVVTASGRRRDLIGLNRAMHAVLEAAITASRLKWIPRAEASRRLADLQGPVEKTGGPRERRAFAMVVDYIAEHAGR